MIACAGLYGIVATSFVMANDEETQARNSCRVTSFTQSTDDQSPELLQLAEVANDLNESGLDTYASRFNYCLGENEQYSWTNIPGARSGGIWLGALREDQQEKVWNLLQSFLGDSAYDRVHFLATDIEKASGAGTVRDYTVALFGNPSTDSAWGFQFDGHHIALNFVVDANQVILSPAFLGSQPTTLKGITPLSSEIEEGRHFISELTTTQKEFAYVPDLVRRDVLVGSGRGQMDQGAHFDFDEFHQIGLSYRSLNEEQRTLFRHLLGVYVNRLNSVFARSTMEKVEERLDSGFFVYSMNRDRIYYRIYVENGILIEYSDVASDHIHTVVRLLGSRPHVDYGGFVSRGRDTTSMIVNHLLTSEHHREDLAKLFASSNGMQ